MKIGSLLKCVRIIARIADVRCQENHAVNVNVDIQQMIASFMD